MTHTIDLEDSSAEIVLFHTEIEALRATNADLLEALEDCMALLHTVTMEQPDAKWVNENGWKSTTVLYRQAGEAIQKARESERS